MTHGNGKKRRLVLCFDGTWNTSEDNTNVSRLYAEVSDQHAGCGDQRKYYDEGVGTSWGSKIAGGTLGWGLDENILQGYVWLIHNYENLLNKRKKESDGEVFEDGDEIFLFGFSRGAFTARSLAGLINRCGLPRRERFGAGGKIRIDSPLVQQAWELYREKYKGSGEARRQPPWKKFREDNCWNVKIRFIGVWDTVGALGIPMFRNSIFPALRDRYAFHDTRLGRVIEHAYHALAIDEHRKDFDVTLWTGRHPVGTQAVEQRWFPGAHANVGGGYEDDLLPDPPLKWLAEKAIGCGLHFSQDIFSRESGEAPACEAELPVSLRLTGAEHLGPVRDSYKEFMFGIYRIAKLGRRWYRPMLVSGENETVDPTAHLRWAADARYRPRNLAYRGRADINLEGEREEVVTVPDNA